MKLCFILGAYVCPRPLDFNDLWTNPRGLSGSDIGVVMNAKYMAKKGHEVSLYTVHAPNKPTVWENVKLFDVNEITSIKSNDYDAIISWCDPNPLEYVPKEPLRIVSHQLNKFDFCKGNFHDFFDVWISPSEVHKQQHQTLPNAPLDKEWIVIPNGCLPEEYDSSKKIPGRVIWLSSAERGLHLLLSVWPQIKQKVPEAHLKIFYNFNYGDLEKYEKGFFNSNAEILEFAQRIRYIRNVIPKLKDLGVEQLGSASREIIAKELSEAMVMAYPCDPTIFCEGFSVSIMEACMAECAPVISNADALGDIYNGVVPMVKRPVRDNLPEFVDLVVKALTDKNYRDEINKKCKEFAGKHTWESGANKLEHLILNHSKIKKN